MQRQIQSKVIWRASGKVLMYEYQSVENDLLFMPRSHCGKATTN